MRLAGSPQKRKMQNYSVIGKRVPRLDAKEKASGKAKYAGHIELPMMLHGKALRSPFPHARILNIDTRRVEELVGVKAVVTAKDVPNNMWGTDRQDDCVMANCLGRGSLYH